MGTPRFAGKSEIYENFAATRPRQPAGPQQQQRAVPGAAPRRIWPAALLGACLVLLAACLGLGVRYWQASQRQAAESSALAQRLGSQEENLTQALQQLSWAQAELDATRLALRQSWQVGNGTQREMEEEQRRSQSLLSRLQQEKEEATRELEAAKRVLGRAASCQQIDTEGFLQGVLVPLHGCRSTTVASAKFTTQQDLWKAMTLHPGNVPCPAQLRL